MWLPEPLGLCWLFFHPLLRFSASVGAVLCSLFGFPCLWVTELLACGVCGACWLRRWCSLCCPSWLGLLLLFLAWGSSFGVCSDLGWKAAVLSWFLSSFFLRGGGSPSLVLVVFAWQFHRFGCPRSLSFLELFAGVLSSRFRGLLIARGGCRIVLGYPSSVAWRREVLPWFSVRGMSACPSGAAVPLGSSVLRSSWSSRWGHMSQVGTVFFLSPRSYRRLSLLLVGLVPGLRAGSPTSGWRCVLRPALVPEAVPPSTRFGPAPRANQGKARVNKNGWLNRKKKKKSCTFALGSSSQGQVCVGASTVCFSCVFLRDVVTLWVKSIFCHS